MPEHPSAAGAVFLSYASQDAEAAKRICAALRTAGVEVWFDTDGGLEHGDEWDRKIRRQIKECVLFLPIISANTQAREEGYFRLEWDLAAERARTIASGVAFILPVVIDDTKEPAALVPDRFRTVQWTRLPGGTVPADVLARFLKLWSHRTGVLHHEATRTAASGPLPSQRPNFRAGLYTVASVTLALFAGTGWWWTHRSASSATSEAAKTAAVISEARQLVAKAWAQMNKAELARAELEVADELCKRAAALDPVDADVWAAWSQVDSWYLFHNLDNSPARREGARTKAARALQLAPGSYEARLAQACQLVRGEGNTNVSLFAAEADGLLRALQQENPDEPRALLARGILLRNTGKADEAREHFRRLAKNPTFTAFALNELGWVESTNGDYRAAEIAADTSIALQPYWGNLTLKIQGAWRWRGDLDLAKATLDRIPAAVQQEDQGVTQAVGVYYLRREPQNMLGVLNSVPREWLQTNGFDGPKAYWAALAHRMAGHGEAAQVQWRKALNLVERRLADQPDSGSLLHWKGLLLAAAGDRAEGETVLRLARDMGNKNSTIGDATDQVLLGNLDAALTLLEKAVAERSRFATAAIYRLNPMYDPLRDQPRFQALLARMEADPRFSPTAKPIPAPSSLLPSPSRLPEADAKSVAVLAFANLSDDKGNEYFSDGISEELLNVLAKIPGLKVTARTSSFHFKGMNTAIPEIAQQLGVAYVIEGSVRKQGDKVRITAQLIKAADGFHVWSDTFTRDLKDIFAVQDEIAGLIAQNLQLKMDLAPVKRIVNPEAHRLVLEGRHYWLQRTDEAFARAQELYAKALAIDPEFAEAHAGIADVFVVRGWYHALSGASVTAADFTRAREEANIALRLDPTRPEPHASLAAVNYNEGRFPEAELAFKEALRLNPNYAVALHWRSHLLMAQGRPDEALASIERSIELDPFSSITLVIYANWLEHTGRNADAVAVTDRAMALRTDQFVPLYGTRALALWNVGRREEAVAAARVVTRDPKQEPRWWTDGGVVYVLREAGLVAEARAHRESMLGELREGSTARAAVFAGMEEPERAIAELGRPERRLAGPGETFYATTWATTRADPRYAQLMEKLGRGEAYRRAQETLRRMKGGER